MVGAVDLTFLDKAGDVPRVHAQVRGSVTICVHVCVSGWHILTVAYLAVRFCCQSNQLLSLRPTTVLRAHTTTQHLPFSPSRSHPPHRLRPWRGSPPPPRPGVGSRPRLPRC